MWSTSVFPRVNCYGENYDNGTLANKYYYASRIQKIVFILITFILIMILVSLQIGTESLRTLIMNNLVILCSITTTFSIGLEVVKNHYVKRLIRFPNIVSKFEGAKMSKRLTRTRTLLQILATIFSCIVIYIAGSLFQLGFSVLHESNSEVIGVPKWIGYGYILCGVIYIPVIIFSAGVVLTTILMMFKSDKTV